MRAAHKLTVNHNLPCLVAGLVVTTIAAAMALSSGTVRAQELAAQTHDKTTQKSDTPSAQHRQQNTALRLAIADRQRLLIERAAKAACYAASGVDADAHHAELRRTVDAIDHGQRALLNGAPELGLPAETDFKITDALKLLSAGWTALKTKLDSSANPSKSTTAEQDLHFALINADAVTVLASDALQLIEYRAETEAAVPIEMAIAISIAGRQRMLLERLSKGICMVSQGIDVRRQRALARGTIALFVSTKFDLRQGIKNLPITSVQRRHVSDQYDILNYMWRDLSGRLQRIVTANEITRDDLTFTAANDDYLSSVLTTEMEMLVKLARGEQDMRPQAK